MRGKVKWYNAEKGFGFVRADDGNDYFAHIREFADGTDELAEGQTVEFTPGKGPKGLKAAGLRLVGLLLIVLAAALFGGCTQGQMAPKAIKECVYAAKADALVTAEQIDQVIAAAPAEGQQAAKAQQLEAALSALRRIGGTKDAAYEDGLLSPVAHWFRGSKPKAGDQ